jgi:hypothetical protein
MTSNISGPGKDSSVPSSSSSSSTNKENRGIKRKSDDRTVDVAKSTLDAASTSAGEAGSATVSPKPVVNAATPNPATEKIEQAKRQKMGPSTPSSPSEESDSEYQNGLPPLSFSEFDPTQTWFKNREELFGDNLDQTDPNWASSPLRQTESELGLSESVEPVSPLPSADLETWLQENGFEVPDQLDLGEPVEPSSLQQPDDLEAWLRENDLAIPDQLDQSGFESGPPPLPEFQSEVDDTVSPSPFRENYIEADAIGFSSTLRLNFLVDRDENGHPDGLGTIMMEERYYISGKFDHGLVPFGTVNIPLEQGIFSGSYTTSSDNQGLYTGELVPPNGVPIKIENLIGPILYF